MLSASCGVIGSGVGSGATAERLAAVKEVGASTAASAAVMDGASGLGAAWASAIICGMGIALGCGVGAEPIRGVGLAVACGARVPATAAPSRRAKEGEDGASRPRPRALKDGVEVGMRCWVGCESAVSSSTPSPLPPPPSRLVLSHTTPPHPHHILPDAGGLGLRCFRNVHLLASLQRRSATRAVLHVSRRVPTCARRVPPTCSPMLHGRVAVAPRHGRGFASREPKSLSFDPERCS